MESKLEFPPSAILTPYNYFEWKPKIQLHLRSRGLFRITMETEVEPTSAVEKSRYFNRMDEAFGILCFSISLELLFYVESCSTPNQVWKILEELFGKQNEMLKMVEDSIAIYRNCRESFSLEPEDPHVASLYATNYVQGLQETDGGEYDDNDPLDSISNLREIERQTSLQPDDDQEFEFTGFVVDQLVCAGSANIVEGLDAQEKGHPDSPDNESWTANKAQKVAAAKVRRAHEAVVNGRPFSETLVQVLYNLNDQLQTEDIDIPLTQIRPIKKIAIVVVTGDRGLCGGYNNFVLKKAERRMAELRELGINYTVVSIGKKGNSYFNSSLIQAVAESLMSCSPTEAGGVPLRFTNDLDIDDYALERPPDWVVRIRLHVAHGGPTGLMAWDTSTWPYYDSALQTPSGDKDSNYLQACNEKGKVYMATPSPWFFKNIQSDSCCSSACMNSDENNCNCQLKGNYQGPGLWLTRWQQIISLNPPLVKIVTWNDWVESSYVAPPLSVAASDVASFTHHAFLDLGEHYIRWYKTGKQPSVTQDSLYLFYYTHSKNAKATADLSDDVYVTAVVTQPASVVLTSGSVSRTFSASARIQTFSMSFNEGQQSASLKRGGAVIKSVSGGIKITISDISCYNFNVYFTSCVIDSG